MNLLEGLNQPSIDDNIKKANDILDDYIKEHKNDYKGGVNMPNKDLTINTDLKSINIGDFDDVIVLILNVIINDTQLDDRLIKLLSDLIKDAVPDDKFEPVMGKLLVQLGEELQAK